MKLVRVLDACSLKELLSRGRALVKRHGIVQQPTDPLLLESVRIPVILLVGLRSTLAGQTVAHGESLVLYRWSFGSAESATPSIF